MLKKSLVVAASILTLVAGQAQAQDRYKNRPPVIVSPDLTAPWVMQLGGQPQQARRVIYRQQIPTTTRKQYYQGLTVKPQAKRRVGAPLVQPVNATRAQRPVKSKFDPQYLPQTVAYDGKEKAGTIVIDTNNRFLYLVAGNGQARRYGVGVGKPGFEWAGAHKVTRKAEWPSWTPPTEMISREAAKGTTCRPAWTAARKIRLAHAPCISARRFTASTAPMRPGRSVTRSPQAASACATRTSSISMNG